VAVKSGSAIPTAPAPLGGFVKRPQREADLTLLIWRGPSLRMSDNKTMRAWLMDSYDGVEKLRLSDVDEAQHAYSLGTARETNSVWSTDNSPGSGHVP